MNFVRRKCAALLVTAGICFFSQAVLAVLFEPGVGVGVEYTDNAALTRDNRVDDVITVGYVGARISEGEGALKYDAATSLNNQHYTQNTFSDQTNFNLRTSADWEMIKNRFNWFLSDIYTQRTINSFGSNTPSNLQDSNAFTLGANIRFPVSARQDYALIPTYSQYYYQDQTTDNKQYALAANWNYQLFRLTNIGFILSAREINYTETNTFGQSPDDTTFTNAAITFNTQRVNSTLSANLGVTHAERDNGQGTTGFSGSLSWLANLSSRSKLAASASTSITDTNTVAFSDQAIDTSDDVQITTDVVRNSRANLTYSRDDTSFNTRLSAQYNEIKYSDSPLDRIIQYYALELNRPVTELLSSGVYVNYNYTKQVDTNRQDDRYTVGGDLTYSFSRKISGLFDLSYRKKDSTFGPDNYDEFSVFFSVVYGFGNVQRPALSGGF